MSRRNRILALIAVIVVIDVIAFFVVPPFDPIEGVDAECVYPICFINGNLELPAPHADLPGRPPHAAGPRRVGRQHLATRCSRCGSSRSPCSSCSGS